jgi:hypothetical protein
MVIVTTVTNFTEGDNTDTALLNENAPGEHIYMDQFFEDVPPEVEEVYVWMYLLVL